MSKAFDKCARSSPRCSPRRCRRASAAGAFAFHYRAPLTPRQLRWFSRFDLLVTHDPLPRAQVGTLANEWQRALRQRHPDALLNRDGLRGGVGSAEADAWYYDPASEEHRVECARAIARRLDTTTEESVHPAALAEFKALTSAPTTITSSRDSWRTCGASCTRSSSSRIRATKG